MKRRGLVPVSVALLTLLADAALAMPATRYGAAFLLLWVLPGLAWAGLLAGERRRPTLEDVALGLGMGMGTVIVLTLLLYYVPGPLPFPLLLVPASRTI